ncbi:methyltransferase domain-containing protein [Bdellovibrio bacteriovorus]|uniref:Putative sun protein n=1 Tax=Bdellovibrio bacteriovorus (strain ATCC 15356 / DSM 50701 / NCIMB 9529 / HD100) TaxID=264462 RepID=Q6MNX6_BDEBA|nr:methyltransferase domain-containing protein [Bdellovibrio bacteriovorus]CAE79023.1 putative sun protein [Bdellovibrio bacteriovorus HD100]
MKIHKHLVSEIVTALDEIFEQGFYADKVIQRHLKANSRWGSRDRRFFAESVYEIVRWERLLSHLADDNDLWKVWGAYWVRGGNELPDWEELDGLDPKEVIAREKNVSSFAIAQSIPDWMHERGTLELGEEWKDAMRALNKPAEVFLRTNTLKTTPDELIKTLEKDGINATKVSPDLPNALRLVERKNVFITESFKQGLFEVQDAASQMVAPLLGIEPGHRVIDACAGAGGKSLHMASMMKNKGKIISLDIHDWKLKELKVRARRDGVDVIETRLIDSNKVIKRLYDTADRVLLDVPCSGMGVLRRNPDTKWKLSNEEIDRLHGLQYEILSTYCNMTKKGGQMVYATCSLLPSENEKQIEKFMAEHGKDWTLLKQIHVRPDKEGYDGFYAALLKRN